MSNSSWPRSAIDRFILAKLEEHSLEPSAPADKRTLIRRATFDLIGLPPTPEEVAEFLADQSPEAFAKVVERLLASPRYGERWGRHWLDVARYADSNGMDENLAYASAWRYRDYVVAAFNADKPYDRFIREQLAGDLLATTDASSDFEPIIATGFLAIGPKMLAEDDPVKMEMDIIDEQLDTASRAFMGLTVGCARCHDHKFDPVPTADYYAMAGIFKSTHTMDNFKVVARWQERPLGTSAQIEKLAAHRQRIDEAQQRINRLVADANERLLREARARAGEYLLAATEQRSSAVTSKEPKLIERGGTTNTTLVPEFVKQWAAYLEKTEKDTNSVFRVWREFAAGRQVAANEQVQQWNSLSRPSETRPSTEGAVVQLKSKPVGQSVPAEPSEEQLRNSLRRLAGDGLAQPGALRNQSPVGRSVPAEPSNEQSLHGSAARRDGLALPPKSLKPLPTATEGETTLAFVVGLKHASDSPASLILLRDPPPQTLVELAQRYAEQFAQADQAWQRLKSSTNGAKAEKLSDPVQESFRLVLYAPKGPFELPKNVESYYATNQIAELKTARDDLQSLERKLPALPEAMAVSDGVVQNLRVHKRGSHLALGDVAPRGFLSSIGVAGPRALGTNQSGRLALANWIASPEHPLTARVMVNRIWSWHFGEGPVRSPDNFGTLGEKPTHPELLDWLARRFVESGWRVKAMHRLIMNSAVYQQTSVAADVRRLTSEFQREQSLLTSAATLDPENRLLSRFPRRRLEAEAIRDSILFFSGALDLKMGGTLMTVSNRTYVTSTASKLDAALFDQPRRSVYLPVIRSALYNVFQILDFADPSTLSGHRDQTTVAPQALFMLNSKLVTDATRRVAVQLVDETGLDDSARMEKIYRIAYNRSPSESERTAALKYLDQYATAARQRGAKPAESRLKAWQSFARTVVAANEFIYVE